MHRGSWAIAVLFILLCWGAAGQETVFGNWEGAILSGELGGRPLAAKIIAQGGGQYRAIFSAGGADNAARLGTLSGKRDDKKVVFSGEIDLGPLGGGRVTVSCEATGHRLTGELRSGKGAGSFEIQRVFKRSRTLGAAPPPGAIMLFDGKSFTSWHVTPRWRLTREGGMAIAGGSIVTRQEFADVKIHVEFRTPLMPGSRGQARGNSGVYVQGRYEVQVLDSFALEGEDNECGAVYKIARPRVNACLPPTEWQTYDITFYAPVFDGAGARVKQAEITVLHNGVTIHDKLQLPVITPGGVSDTEAPKGPLLLQDHGDPVEYRNIWIQPLN